MTRLTSEAKIGRLSSERSFGTFSTESTEKILQSLLKYGYIDFMNPKMLMLAVGALVIIASSAFLLTKNSTNEVPEMSPTPTSAVMMDETSEASPSVTTTMIKDDEDDDVDESSEMSDKKAVKEFTVIGSSFKFAPATMTVKKGDVVTIIFKNSGGMHDFVIDELGVKTKVIASGAEETVQFTASKVGTFEYYCSVGNHRTMGMVGKITIVE